MITDVHEIFDQEKNTNYFSKFLVDIGQKLASIIPESQTKIDPYLNLRQTFMVEATLLMMK